MAAVSCAAFQCLSITSSLPTVSHRSSCNRGLRASFGGCQLRHSAAIGAARKAPARKDGYRMRVTASDSDVEVVQTGDILACGAPFYKVEAVLRPWRVNLVTQALLTMGIRGATLTDVRGFGAQGASRERQAGSEFVDANYVQKVKLEIVVVTTQVEAVIATIIDAARTGEFGDGKIFVSPVADVIRVRTGERGVLAERMAGGRSDLLATGSGVGAP